MFSVRFDDSSGRHLSFFGCRISGLYIDMFIAAEGYGDSEFTLSRKNTRDFAEKLASILNDDVITRHFKLTYPCKENGNYRFVSVVIEREPDGFSFDIDGVLFKLSRTDAAKILEVLTNAVESHKDDF